MAKWIVLKDGQVAFDADAVAKITLSSGVVELWIPGLNQVIQLSDEDLIGVMAALGNTHHALADAITGAIEAVETAKTRAAQALDDLDPEEQHEVSEDENGGDRERA